MADILPLCLSPLGLLPIIRPSTMGLQSRLVATAKPSDDIEKSPLLDTEDTTGKSPRRHHRRLIRRLIEICLLLSVWSLIFLHFGTSSKYSLDFPFPSRPTPIPPFVSEGVKQCEIIARPPPSPKPYTGKRKVSDRYVTGTGAVLLKNATLWTGEEDGEEVLRGVNVLMDGGVIHRIGGEDLVSLVKEKKAEEVELHGAWVTPGIVDLHSHLAVDPAPALRGSADTNSAKSPILPWLRSLDGFNTHDLAFNLSISGGVTTMLVLPGSAGNIGGQAFVFKPRWTYENTPQSMQVEPPFVIVNEGNGTWERTGTWRHIKHATGENPSRFYGNTRMDSAYDFRRAYNEGRKLKEEQERWCASPKTQDTPFPTNLEWEVLADVIRGNVKVNIHCYETTDINSLVRISNEFQFPIAAFHHAHETYLVPDLLKQAWGPVPPAAAIFATNARYKRESYRGSEFAPKILADNGLNVVMKSDHPVLDSRYLVYEAAQAHHYGLNSSQALGSVTTHPARAMGMDHRLGYVREGYDADLVVWDSFPLSLGATPKQTYIDGIPQIIKPHVVPKPAEAQEVSHAGSYDKEAAEAVATRGDPDLRPKQSAKNVVFQDVAALYLPGRADVAQLTEKATVIIRNGTITCVGQCAVQEDFDYTVIDLKGGSIAPGLITVGSYLGLMEIRQEKSTWDGAGYDPLTEANDLIEGLLVHAVDGVSFGSKDELLAYRSGVATAVAFPISFNLFAGLSFSFSVGSPHPLSHHAILNPGAALHLTMDNSRVSISTKIAILRRLLLGEEDEETELTRAMESVAKGELRLVVHVSKADVMAALVRLKKEIAPQMKMTFLGGHEAWMVSRSPLGDVCSGADEWK